MRAIPMQGRACRRALNNRRWGNGPGLPSKQAALATALLSARFAGPHFGLTPKKHQSGETDRSGRISKVGDAAVREALYQAAHVMLTKPVKGCSQLKSWAMRIARRAGMSKAKVALARKLAVILHRMLANATPFNAAAAAA